MKKGIVGIAIVIGTFLLIWLLFILFGGDSGQSKRSEWFPLVYIIPVMAGLAYYLIKKEGEE